jgi:hypothetical protein
VTVQPAAAQSQLQLLAKRLALAAIQ